MIRRGTASDLPAIEEIQSGSREAGQWTPAEFLVAEYESQVVGFLVTREIATGEYEILNVAVAPEFRRRRVALELIKYAISQAPGAYFLEVRESNQAAQQLYRKVGFTPVGVRRNYYSDPDESAIVMRFYS